LKTKEEEMKKKRQGRPWRRAEEALFGLNCGHDPERKTGKRKKKQSRQHMEEQLNATKRLGFGRVAKK
jgi:hypothetical protein